MENETEITIFTFEKGGLTYYLDKMTDCTFSISQDENVLESGFDSESAITKFIALSNIHNAKIVLNKHAYDFIYLK